jgi:hypothetical protein
MLDMQNGIEQKEDYVNHPKHYMQGSIECIRYLEDSLGDGFSYYLEGSIKKYLHRWRHKNAGNHAKQIEDLEKALFYLRALIEDEKA